MSDDGGDGWGWDDDAARGRRRERQRTERRAPGAGDRPERRAGSDDSGAAGSGRPGEPGPHGPHSHCSALELRELARRPERRIIRRRQRRVLLMLAFMFAALVVIIGLGWFYYFHTGPEGGPVTVTIPNGASLAGVAQILEQRHVVPRARAFEIRAQSDGYAAEIKPGTYRLRVNEPYDTLIATLINGNGQPAVRVTIPEGFTLAQTAALVATKVPGFSAKTYLDLTQRHPIHVAITGYRPGRTLEGLLFPSTYFVSPAITPLQFIDRQLAAFSTAMAQVSMTRARKKNLTPYDVTIIASLIEREAEVASERPLIAAVIWNRLHLHMLLQIDATVEYALGKHKAVLSFSDLKVNSPYNTYLHAGLPPTPIANPGLASLIAAANPASVSYLYYVARGDGSGRHYFSSTYSQFLKDEARAQH